MKTRVFSKWHAGLTLLLLPLFGGCLQEANSSSEVAAPSETAASINNSENEGVAAVEPAPEEIADTAEPATSETSAAPVSVVSTEAPLPPNVKPTAPTREVIQLAESGTDLSVMLAFVTNSASTFNLSSDDVVYLSDLGIPSTVIAAMLQRDQALKENLINLATTAAEPPPLPALQTPEPTPAAFSTSLQAPEEIAQTDSPTESYPPPQPAEAADPAFYDSLAPYGTWVDVDGYGQCWRPAVGVINAGWQPYFDSGRWVYTDCGWYWMSDYSWGWAPFHYGRWFQHNRLGWCWVPGTVWGPSWVCWRYTDNYCGWAPLPPAARFTAGIGLTFNGQRVSPFFGFGLAANCFPFVPLRNLCDHNPRRHLVPASQVASFYNHTVAFAGVVPHNHSVFNHGIAPERVGAAGHTQIQTVAIHEVPSAPRNGFREHFEAHNTALATLRVHPSRPGANHLANAANSRTQSPGEANSSTPALPSQTAPPPPSAQPVATDSRPSSSQHFVIRGEHWGAASHGISAQRNSLVQTSNQQAEQAGAPAPPRITPSRPQSSAQQTGQSVSNERQTLAVHRETIRAQAEEYSRYDAAPLTASPQQAASPAHHSSFEALRLGSASGAPAQRPHPLPAAARHETPPVLPDDQSDATPRQFSIPTRHPFAEVSHQRASPAAIPERVQAPPPPGEQHPVTPAPAPETHSSPPSAPAPATPSAPASHGTFHSSSNGRSR